MNDTNKTIYSIIRILVLFTIIVAAAYTLTHTPGDACLDCVPRDPVTETQGITYANNLVILNNSNELSVFLAARQTSATYAGYGGRWDGEARISQLKEYSSDASSPLQAPSGDYGQTNIQIKGVDEADFIKNDGTYLYILSGSSKNILAIIDARQKGNTSDASIISETILPDVHAPGIRGKELFIKDDTLIVFAEGYVEEFYFQKYDIQPIPINKPKTTIYIYDVSDRTHPKLLERYSVAGNYQTARLIGNEVYVVAQDNIYYPYVRQPIIMDDLESKIIASPSIYYFDNHENNNQLTTLTSIDLDTNEIVDSETLMLGYGTTVMVSEENIYVAYLKNNYWCWGWNRCTDENDKKAQFETIVLPLLKGDIRKDIERIRTQYAEDEETQWREITTTLSAFYAKIENDEAFQTLYEPMLMAIADAIAEDNAKKALDKHQTIIHKIAISDGIFSYDVEGIVPGRLLNQFSLDEYKNYLRVATTVDVWTDDGRINDNNVYILDDSLRTVGKVEHIAKGESIYATRFMGDTLYMVTFRQIDPFFVIDLSNPKNPTIRGALKIPGYSSYLHPYKDHFIIGVGKDVGENEWGGTSAKGIKISLFDVSDFEHPREIDKYIIGEAGSDSAILYDHKAFLFSDTKNIMVIPVTEVDQRRTQTRYEEIYTTWNGAYVFTVTEDGFELLGKVKHASSSSDYVRWWNLATVTRSTYIGDVLYTISEKYVKANSISEQLRELQKIVLPDDGDSEEYSDVYAE